MRKRNESRFFIHLLEVVTLKIMMPPAFFFQLFISASSVSWLIATHRTFTVPVVIVGLHVIFGQGMYSYFETGSNLTGLRKLATVPQPALAVLIFATSLKMPPVLLTELIANLVGIPNVSRFIIETMRIREHDWTITAVVISASMLAARAWVGDERAFVGLLYYLELGAGFFVAPILKRAFIWKKK